MSDFLNVWMPYKLYAKIKDDFDVPVLFAFIKDGRPSLELHAQGSQPNYKIEQAMFVRLPMLTKPNDEPLEAEFGSHGPLTSREVSEKETTEDENNDGKESCDPGLQAS